MNNGKLLVVMVAMLTAIAVGILINLTSEIVIPLIIAWFLVQISHPVIAAGERMRLPHILNVALVFLVIFFLLSLGISFFVTQAKESERIFNQYGGKLSQLMAQIVDTLQIPTETVSIVGLLKRYVGNISGRVINFGSQFVMTLVFLAFMLLETPTIDSKLDAAFPGSHSGTIKNILESISRQTSRYLGTMVIVSLITGFCVWAVLFFIGVEFAAGWGILAFLLNFIPTAGSVIATVPPVLMALLQFAPSYSEAVVTLVAIGIIQMVTGNVLLPKMLGDSLGLSPVVIMLSLLLWGMILGLPGAILSVPIAAIIKIVCENFPSLRPIAIMMGTGPRRRNQGSRLYDKPRRRGTTPVIHVCILRYMSTAVAARIAVMHAI